VAAIGPSAGERARTVLACAPTLEVEVADGAETVAVHGVQPDGALALLVPERGTLARWADGLRPWCTVRAAQVTSVPSPDRVVDRVTVRGHLCVHPDVPAGMDTLMAAASGEASDVLPVDAAVLLRVNVRGVLLGHDPVSVSEFATAACDPLATVGDVVVAHLAVDHAADVRALAALLGDPFVDRARSVTPIGIDRFGITLLARSAVAARRVRLDFPAPVRGAHEVRSAMQELYRATRAAGRG
jgi:hypothetical protein